MMSQTNRKLVMKSQLMKAEDWEHWECDGLMTVVVRADFRSKLKHRNCPVDRSSQTVEMSYCLSRSRKWNCYYLHDDDVAAMPVCWSFPV